MKAYCQRTLADGGFNIEAGVKGLWFDNRLCASAAVFRNEHSDMQLSVSSNMTLYCPQSTAQTGVGIEFSLSRLSTARASSAPSN
ncbi:MAG: TonB-dependent receptor [Gammaproteobacteria bacterium]|nr:TonB-dependent receptor [Gammaproteobacteria bacterium]